MLRGLSEQKLSMRNLGLARRNAMLIKDNLVQDDLDLTIREAEEYKLAGGHTLINCDLPGMGRDPMALRKIARATGSISSLPPDGTCRRRIRRICGARASRSSPTS